MPGSIKYQFNLPQIVKSLIIDKCRTLSNVNILEKNNQVAVFRKR